MHSLLCSAGPRERNDDSRKLQERIEALLEEQDTTHNSRVQFSLYLMRMIPRIHDLLLVDFLDDSHRLLLQYVLQSDIIMLQETQQQQQQQQLYHHPHQQPFVSHDIQFQPQAFNLHFRSPSISRSRSTSPFQSSQSASPKSGLWHLISMLCHLYRPTYVQ